MTQLNYIGDGLLVSGAHDADVPGALTAITGGLCCSELAGTLTKKRRHLAAKFFAVDFSLDLLLYCRGLLQFTYLILFNTLLSERSFSRDHFIFRLLTCIS